MNADELKFSSTPVKVSFSVLGENEEFDEWAEGAVKGLERSEADEQGIMFTVNSEEAT